MAWRTGNALTPIPDALSLSTRLSRCTRYPSAGVFNTLTILAGETVGTIHTTAKVFDAESIYAAVEEWAADLSAGGDALATSTEFTCRTRDSSASIGYTLNAVTDTPRLTAYIHTRVRDTLSFPAAISRVWTINIGAGIDTH